MKKTDHRYRFLFDNMSQGVVFQDGEGRITRANPAAARILRTSIDRLQGRVFPNLEQKAIREDGTEFPFDRHPGVIALETGREAQAVMGIFNPAEDEYRWISVRSVPLQDTGEGKQSAVLTVLDDVTEYRMADEAVSKGVEQYRLLPENMKDVVWIIAPETFTFRYVSPSVGKLLGYSQEEFIAMPLAANMPRKEAERVHSIVRERMKAFLESGGEKEAFYTDEILETRKDGSRVWTEIVTKYYLDTVRGKLEIQGVSRDISERKKAEAALQKSLEEKNVLMRELQHRVKNTLNVVNSLLALESSRLTDENSKRIFLDAQTRIQAMSGIYERLYRSKSLDRIHLDEYVRDFAESLHELYSMDPGKVRFVMDLDEVEIDLKRALPLCLVLNELVSNALKYAYPGDSAGELSISVKRGAGNVELRVRDFGAGIPPAVDPLKTDSMGFVLVRNLSEQLGGSVTFTSATGKGTAVAVVFPY